FDPGGGPAGSADGASLRATPTPESLREEASAVLFFLPNTLQPASPRQTNTKPTPNKVRTAWSSPRGGTTPPPGLPDPPARDGCTTDAKLKMTGGRAFGGRRRSAHGLSSMMGTVC